jgi:cytochrome c
MKAYLQFIRIALPAVTCSIGLAVSLFVLSNNSVLAADGKLSNQQAKQLISELFNKQPDKLEVLGVFQPQENVAQADVAITNLAIAIPKNDAVTAYAFGSGGGTRIWSGRGKANFMRYNDGAWVITTLDTDAGSFSPKSRQPAAPAQQPQTGGQEQQAGPSASQQQRPVEQLAVDQTALATKNKCLVCHAVDRRIVGPSFKEIAARYRSDPSAADRLVASVRQGGAGKWGNLPEPPQANVSNADLVSIVRWILSR